MSAVFLKLCLILSVEFFDIFSQLDLLPTAESGQFALEKILKLSGWRLSVTPEKRKPFARVCVSLGVELDFTELAKGFVGVSNKPGRVKEIVETVNRTLENPKTMFGFKDAPSLRGRIGYAET